jgi:hypothetical protein
MNWRRVQAAKVYKNIPKLPPCQIFTPGKIKRTKIEEMKPSGPIEKIDKLEKVYV